MVGFGMVLRDDAGQFIASSTRTRSGLFSAKECEALGLIEAISWVSSLGYKKVNFEVDAKMVVDACLSFAVDYAEFGSLVSHARMLLQQEMDFSLSLGGS
ncbi:hypothetical protein PTKIN_Ptkin15bG0110800 [Pterospermum kingtungense]